MHALGLPEILADEVFRHPDLEDFVEPQPRVRLHPLEQLNQHSSSLSNLDHWLRGQVQVLAQEQEPPPKGSILPPSPAAVAAAGSLAVLVAPFCALLRGRRNEALHLAF